MKIQKIFEINFENLKKSKDQKGPKSRIHPGKEECLLADVQIVDGSERMGERGRKWAEKGVEPN